MMKNLVFAGLLLFIVTSNTASAQMSQLPEIFAPVPHEVPVEVSTWKAPTAARVKPLKSDSRVDAIAVSLDRQFREILAAPKPATCSSPAAADYANRLLISQNLDACVAFAQACAADSAMTSPQVLEIGGECEHARYRPVEARRLYELATSSKYASSSDYQVAVLKSAADAYNGIFESETVSILSKGFPSSELEFWKGVVAEDELPTISREEVRKFIDQKLAESSGRLEQTLKAFKVRKSILGYKHADALDQIAKFVDDFESPYAVYALAYKAVYRGMDQDFAQARKIYDVFDRYSSPNWQFPTEENTYNYTELYGQICKASLLSKSQRSEFDSVRAKVRVGAMGPADSLARLAAMAQRYPGKADVLTTYGALLALNGRHEEAKAAYWSAHRACRYYNRANWGLALEERSLRYRSYPEYTSNEKKVDIELSKIQVPNSITKYIRNWNAFDRETQKRIEYGSRIWLPYMGQLKAQNFTTYIKFSFDLLSESPNLSSVRDVRIGGTNYPNDNRLWDDVRGLGGSTVVADAAEVFQTVQGDYNLLGHEMAHQFQYLMEKVYQPGLDCIVRLYAEAKSRARFPDPYSGQNKEEHFAQGVTYSMIPADSPKRYGFNRSWLTANDPNQLRFIESIEASTGDLNAIRCSN